MFRFCLVYGVRGLMECGRLSRRAKGSQQGRISWLEEINFAIIKLEWILREPVYETVLGKWI